MSWSDPSRRAAILGLLALAGCGFTPAYAPGGTGTALAGRVAVTAPADVLGYRVGTRLQTRLGQAAQPVFLLTVTPRMVDRAAALTRDGTRARVNLVGEAGWVLTDSSTGAIIGQGEVSGFTGYSTTGSTVAARAAEEDARDRLAIVLADLVMTKLLALPPP